MLLSAKEYLESSFLKPLLYKEGVTDISYNGESFYYMDNLEGRKKAEISKSPEEVGDFLKQLANLCERQFSFSSPLLDTSFSRYRLNAVHSALVRHKENKTFSFSIRIASETSLLTDSFFPPGVKEAILRSLARRESIVIGGITGSGKTELQKYLLLQLKDNARVIVIDNVEELDLIRNPLIDQTTWVSNERIEGGNIDDLVRNSLRSNPDYVIVAESRGKEFEYALSSAMSGHPIITTIHAKSVDTMIDRMARLALLGKKDSSKSELIEDILSHFSLFIHLDREIVEGKVTRYIDSVARIEGKEKVLRYIYSRKENHETF